MRLLLDTHVLLWAAYSPHKIPLKIREFLEEDDARLFFSPISLWEIAIKQNKSRSDLECNLPELRRELESHRSYEELPVTSEHALHVEDLPSIHNDPFDRMLLAQARVEGLLLMTVDRRVKQYMTIEKDLMSGRQRFERSLKVPVDPRVEPYLADKD